MLTVQMEGMKNLLTQILDQHWYITSLKHMLNIAHRILTKSSATNWLDHLNICKQNIYHRRSAMTYLTQDQSEKVFSRQGIQADQVENSRV
jgi:hypothetical protein